MPGKQTRQSQNPPFLMICVLDCGDPASFRGDPVSREYGYALTDKSWSYLEVVNPDFIKSFPVAAIQLNENEMMIFGGETTKTFIFNTTKDVAPNSQRANVVTSSGLLDRKAKFGHRSDYVCKTFGPIFYAIDSVDQIIHTHEITSLQWYSMPISEFGIAD